MKFMLLIYSAEDSWREDERAACMGESLAICDELAAKGKFLDASPLESVKTAVTVRVRNGQTLVTAGPFTETAEQLGGYYVLDLADLDEAIAVASRLPPVTKGTIEIRPLAELEGTPAGRPVSTPRGESLTPYILLCCHGATAWRELPEETLRAARAEAVANCRRLRAAGKFLSASPLHEPATATSVRVRNGRREITDGPFAETNEVVGGYYLILAESRDEAVKIAAEQPGAWGGSVEVRPVFDLAGLRSRG